jgi:hypothetical protein
VIQKIVINVAKGIAIIVALLVLRAIIGAIGRGVAKEESVQKRVYELEAELADLKAKEIERGA